MKTLLLIIGALSLSSASDTLKAIGNLAIIARTDGLIGTPSDPLLLSATHLICGAQKLGVDVPLEAASFTRESDGKEIAGAIKNNKAELAIGKAPLGVAGKYRCEVRTSTDETIHGNLVIYLSPVFSFDKDVTEVHTADHNTAMLTERIAKKGARVTLKCPATGYPTPFVHWDKNGNPLDSDVEYDGNDITLKNVQAADSGVYACHASNTFPLFVGGPAMPHENTLKIPLKVQ